jgi:hypothetical protein
LELAQGLVDLKDEGRGEGIEGLGTVELYWMMSEVVRFSMIVKGLKVYSIIRVEPEVPESLTKPNTWLWRRYKQMLIALRRRVSPREPRKTRGPEL